MKLSKFSKTDWVIIILIPSLFILGMFLFHPFREVFQYDTDEGIELIKTRLVMEGHQIMGDVWSDHPPLINNIFALIFQVTKPSTNIARMVILIFSAGLLAASGMIAHLIWGRASQISVYIIMVLTPGFLQLSVTAMIGQPSIALSVFAMLFIILWHQDKQPTWLVLAGGSISLSLFSKAFTVFLLPVFCAGLVIGAWIYADQKFNSPDWLSWKRILSPLLIFGISFGGLCIILFITLFNLENLRLPFQFYLSSQNMPAGNPINLYLEPHVYSLELGFLGMIYSIHRKKWLAFYPAGWVLVAYIVLLNISPVWSHHQMLITIPLAIICGGGIGLLFQDLYSKNIIEHWPMRFVAVGMVILFALVLISFLPSTIQQLNRTPAFGSYGLDSKSGNPEMLFQIRQITEKGDVIVTDLPMYAFRAGLTVPPELAVISSKRFQSGYLTEDMIIRAIESYQPEVVLIGRFQLDKVKTFLENDFDLVYKIPIEVIVGQKSVVFLYYRDESPK